MSRAAGAQKIYCGPRVNSGFASVPSPKSARALPKFAFIKRCVTAISAFASSALPSLPKIRARK